MRSTHDIRSTAGTPRPGPFGPRPGRRSGDVAAALATSLLVMYPVIGTVAVLLAAAMANSAPHGLG